MPDELNERMHHHLYSNEGRVEQCERICKLEALATEMAVVIAVLDLAISAYDDEQPPALPLFADRLAGLEIEVPSLGFEVKA